MNVFVLSDCSHDLICPNVIGVFDHSDISDDVLAEYFGEFKRKAFTDFTDARDSWIEWVLTIRTLDNKDHQVILHEYRLNEVT